MFVESSGAKRQDVAYIFPGQGAQVVPMGKAVFDRYPKEVEEASDLLGYRIDRLCLQDPDKQLGQTQFTQPALYFTCALEFRSRSEDKLLQPLVMAGHSLGEYAALYAAGAFSLMDGLRLVAERGRQMATARDGGMTAVIGLPPRRLAEVVADFPEIDIANYNSYDQTVLAGPISALDRAEVALNAAGARAVVRLNVSAAFHSRAMRSAAEAFGSTLSTFTFRPLRLPVISNRKAFAYRDDELATELEAQIMSPVRWVESIEYMLRMGIREFVELGPGKSMSRLIADIRAATPFAN